MGNFLGYNATAKTDLPDFVRMDQLGSAAKLSWNNMLAVIKLR